MALESNYEIAFNAATATEQVFGEKIYSYEIYCETEVLHVKEFGNVIDPSTDWDALSAAAKKAASYRIPASLVHESVIPCRKISVIGASGSGTAYVKTVPLQSNQAICDDEVYEYFAVNAPKR